MKQNYVDQLLKEIEENHAPWQRDWKPGIGVPHNPVTGTVYSGLNFMTLLSTADTNGFLDPRWMTVKEIIKLGFHYDKNAILVPVCFFKQVHKHIEKSLEDEEETSDEVISLFGIHQVINGSQIQGLPKFQESFPDISINNVKAELIASYSGVRIINKFMNIHDSPGYIISKDFIEIPFKQQYYSDSGYYKTLFHELSHSTGHESRLKRDLSGIFGSESYAKEELRAEIAAFFLCMEIGIGYEKQNSLAYLKNWLSRIPSEKEKTLELSKAVSDARKIVEYLIKGHEDELGLKISPDKRIFPSSENNYNNMKTYEPKKNQTYIGEVIAIDSDYVLQKRYGKTYLIRHSVDHLRSIPSSGEFVKITYDSSGKGTVEIYQKGKE